MIIMANNHTINPEHQFIAEYLAWAETGRGGLTLLPHFLFRGQADRKWETLPTLLRIHPALKSEQLKLIEAQVIHEFRKREQLDKNEWDDMDVLTFARHHGAPTRLLDWSQNALVALWFSVENKRWDHLDGKVLSLHIFENSLKVAPAMGDLWLDTVESFKTGQRVLSFTATPKTPRITQQASVFTIGAFDGNVALQSIEKYFGVTDSTKEEGVREFIVPSNLKSKLRKTLSNIGFDTSSIYGGADGLGKSITDKLNAFFE